MDCPCICHDKELGANAKQDDHSSCCVESGYSLHLQVGRFGVHLSHCNFGEYVGVCKYQDESCPALSDAWYWFGRNLQENRRLREKNRLIVDAAWKLIIAIDHHDLGYEYSMVGKATTELEDVLQDHRRLTDED